MDSSTGHVLPARLCWLLAAFAAISLIYLWATPIFEASDELWHFGMVEYIRQNHNLPVQDPNHRDTPWRQEGSQPPLYYAIAAALTLPFDLSDSEAQRQPNPHAKIGIPGADDNKVMVLHDELIPPLRDTVVAVYSVRAFGILLGSVAITAVYCSARMVGGQVVGLVAAGLTAFNPMFLFITASVNNDNLVTALNSVVIYLTLRLLRDGFHSHRSLRLAVLLTLATLTKLSGWVLVPMVLLVGLWVAYTRRDWRGLAIFCGLMAGVWLILAGWWYARNITLYGEFLGTQMMAAVAGPRLESFTIQTLLDEFEGFRISYWGLFGAVNVLTMPLFYHVMDAVTLIAAVGLVGWFFRRTAVQRTSAKLMIVVLGVTVLVSWISVINWTAQTYASQGRLLFPFVAANSTLLAVGLVAIARQIAGQKHALSHRILSVSVSALSVFALFVPITSILPRYVPPQPIDHLPHDVTPVYARFEEIQLIGYQAEDRRYAPSDHVMVTLYWQPAAASQQDYSLYLHALDPQGNEIGKVDTYPGGGRLRTSTWQPGAIYADTYRVPLDERVQGRFALALQVGWWHLPTGTIILPYAKDGKSLGSVILRVGGFIGDAIIDPTRFVPVTPVVFGSVIALEGYHFDEDRLTLLWQVQGESNQDYTVFVQVLDSNDQIIGQGDTSPALPTHYWRVGETYTTTHAITYPVKPPVGTYRVVIGWYHPQEFWRLSVDAPNDAYLLTEIEVN